MLYIQRIPKQFYAAVLPFQAIVHPAEYCAVDDLWKHLQDCL